VFPDSNKKYLTTALLSHEPAKSGYIAPSVKLLGFRALSRVCGSCTSDTDNLPVGWPPSVSR